MYDNSITIREISNGFIVVHAYKDEETTSNPGHYHQHEYAFSTVEEAVVKVAELAGVKSELVTTKEPVVETTPVVETVAETPAEVPASEAPVA